MPKRIQRAIDPRAYTLSSYIHRDSGKRARCYPYDTYKQI